ncbi:hypothetical protein CISIN_1g015770mg [Citrus sinensis]|uniref:Uncharacterized protein n=1 Tax=Citrus sinensis TaxID=2711 RepID=A0A067EMK9_CITSI|nr:hypothetical protein CISIN_1g015770mg [Citrus sinensis]
MRIGDPFRILITPAAAAAAARYHPLHQAKPLLILSHALHPTRTRTRILITRTDTNNMSTISAEDDAKYGFTREEMYKEKLAGTVNPYGRHVFLCFKGPEMWVARVEASDTDTLPKLLASALKTRKDDMTVKSLMTVCGGGEGTDGDVLIFPEMIKYEGLKESDVDSFVDDVLVNGKPWASGVQEGLTGSYVFVCSHGSRDKRCGVCGPALIEKFNAEIDSRGLKDQIFVKPCSHIGGHKYAGNLIVYSPDSEGKIMGHWYGYVTPDDVPAILDQHIAKGEIIERLWRGQLGQSAEVEKVDEKKLPNGKEESKSKKLEDGNTQVTKENVTGGCCQGASGFSCCKDRSSDVTGENKQIETKGQGRLSSWLGSFEQRDVLTAAAVVGAVATIAVAYSIYRRSG